MFGFGKPKEPGSEKRSFDSVPIPEGCRDPGGWTRCVRDINEPDNDHAWDRGIDNCRKTYCD